MIVVLYSSFKKTYLVICWHGLWLTTVVPLSSDPRQANETTSCELSPFPSATVNNRKVSLAKNPDVNCKP